MRQYVCTCLECRENNTLLFDEPYPKYGDKFIRLCKHCGIETSQTLTLTKRVAKELRKEKAEEELKQTIIDSCNGYGFTCRFLYESVIITTPISSWQFQYRSEKKTLRHESTVKINFETGYYAKTHEQFRDRKMTCEEVIDYIAAHDEWRQSQQASDRNQSMTQHEKSTDSSCRNTHEREN